MKKQIASMWVRALRSGEYKQGDGQLLDKRGRYCCLGVLADISGYSDAELLERVNLLGQVERCGLTNYNGAPSDLRDVLGRPTLAGANDSGKSFAEIADWIEQNWEVL